MQKLTGLERILRTVKHQEPDRVPHFEMLIDKKVRDAITRDSSATYEDFIEKMDLDAVVIFDKTWTWTYEVVDAARGIRRDQWGSLVQSTTTDLGYVLEPAIKSKKDIDTYVPPNPDDSWRYEHLRQLVKRWKGQRAIIAHCTDVFETARVSLVGEVPYYEAMVEAPEVCEWANSIVADYNLRFFRNCVDEGADIIMVSGDWAMTEQPMVSRTHTKRFLIPAFRKIVDLAHSRGRGDRFTVRHDRRRSGRGSRQLRRDGGRDGRRHLHRLPGLDHRLGQHRRRARDRRGLRRD